MPPRTLASLAHALGGASDLDAALVALGEGLAEMDRGAHLALLRYDGRREMLRERLTPNGGRVERSPVETTFDHLPAHVRLAVAAGGQFIDLAEQSDEYGRLFGLRLQGEGGSLALRGLRVDGHLAAILALFESKKIFGTRTTERFGPFVSLFELAFMRFAEREAREEAVRTLEDVTQRVHGEYVRKLSVMEEELLQARDAAASPPSDTERTLLLERETARATEEARRATRRARAVEQQVTAAVEQLERAHVELHRRSDSLRQKTRTLYLLERLLVIDNTTIDPRQLVDGMLALVGDDMQAQRVSLLLRAPEAGMLYLAAARGVAPNVSEGTRIPIGTGVAGKVAETRQPLLVEDVAHANQHPLLHDQYFTTGSFISFPLVYQDDLIGVLNLTNRAQYGVFIEEDMERVRLLALVLALVAHQARLAERLLETIGVR